VSNLSDDPETLSMSIVALAFPKEIDLSLDDFERSQTVHASHFLHHDGPPSLRLPVRPH
jgi:hypothetical protein